MSEYKIAVKIAGQLESSFNAALKGAQSGLSGFGLAGKVGAAAVKGTAAAITAAGTAIAGIGAYSVKVGSEFESAMSSASATAAATEEEYAKMEAAAMEMGRTTSKTATESAQALEYMALAGWDVDTSISALPSVLRMSEASGMDLARTSDLVTDSMAALGVTVDELPNYLDAATKAQNKSNQTAEELMEAYLGVGGTMKNLNIPITESATALGVLANRGLKGSEAGTALNAMMVNLTTGTGQAGKMMSQLGISAFDSNGKFIGLEETLKQVNTALQGCTEEERNAALAAIGGKQHVDALNNLMAGLNTTNEEGISEWAALRNELENCNGALEEMAKTKLDNLEGDLAILQSAAQDAGIKIYKNLNTPLRGLAQYGTQSIYKLSEALENGGFSGLASALGDVVADGLVKMADHAPEFVDMAATLVDSLISGIENNQDAIGDSLGRLAVSASNAFIHLMPRLIVLGAKMVVSIARGVLDNLPEIGAAAKEAIAYLMEEAKKALGEYMDFLGDDSAKPFEKIVALIPAVAAGFMAFKSVSGIIGKVNGFVNSLKGIGKAASGAKKGLGTASSSMSTAAQNILGAGAGFALAAAGVWLLANAATQIAQAGPGAALGLAMMAAGIAGFMVLAAKMGPELQANQQGLITFGAAILMAAAGVAVMAFAAVQLAQAGPMAFAGLALMEGGIIALMAIAGTMGTTLASAAPGLIAFGAAILIAAAGMAVMSFAAVQLAQEGGMAVAVLAGMLVGMTAFMAVAALLGPMLSAAAVGLVAFGVAVLLAGAGMLIMAQAAIQLAEAGAPAQIAMALLAAGILAFGAAAGALAPMLLAGAVALAAFGAALIVVGAGMLVVNAAALIGAAVLLVMSGALEQIVENSTGGAEALVSLGASLTAFSGGAALAGAGAAAAGVGFAALALAALALDVAFIPLAVEMLAVSGAIAVISASSSTAAAGMGMLKASSSGMVTSMGKLAAAFLPLTASLAPFAAAAAAAGIAAAALATGLAGMAVSAAAAGTAVLLIVTAFTAATAAIQSFQSSTVTVGAAAQRIVAAFASMGGAVPPAAAALSSFVVPAVAAAAASMLFAAALASSNASLAAMAAAVTASASVFGALSAAMTGSLAAGNSMMQMTVLVSSSMQQMAQATTVGMVQVSTSVQTGMTQVTAITTQSMALIVAVTTNGVTAMVTVFRNGGVQAVGIAQATAAGIQAAFAGVDLSGAGMNMMQGLVNGMNSMRGAVAAAAQSIAQAAASAVNSALQIHSPSKVLTRSGQYAGEGVAVGMENMSGRVQSAANAALAQPVQNAGENIRGISTPEIPARSAVIGETIDSLSGKGRKGTETGSDTAQTFVFSPTYHFEGGETSKEEVVEANRMSMAEFEKMMRQWERKNKRTVFA